MAPRTLLAVLLSCALTVGPAVAGPVQAVPEVTAPVGGGGVSGAGTGQTSLSVAPTLAPVAPSALSAVPNLTPVTVRPGQTAAPAAAVAGAVHAAVALPAAAVPAAHPAVTPAVEAAAAAPGKAPTEGLEGVKERTAEMQGMLGEKNGGAAAGAKASGVAASIFDGGVKRAGAVNGVSEEAGAPAAPALANYFSEADFRRMHPKEGGVYHDWNHSVKVARMAYDLGLARGLAPSDAKFLYEVGLLHDIDPARTPGAPARVPATLEALRKDFAGETALSGQPGRSILREKFGWDAGRLAMAEAMIQRTEFPFGDSHPNPFYKDASPLARYEAQLRALPEGDRRFVLREGALLSEYADKSSWYATEDFDGAAAVVAGLANEINTASGGNAKMTMGKLDTAGFLSVIGEPKGFELDAALAARLGLAAPDLPGRARAWELLGGSFGRRFDANVAGFAAYKAALTAGRSHEEALAAGRARAEAEFQARGAAAAARLLGAPKPGSGNGVVEGRAPPAGQPLAALRRLSDALSSQAGRAQASTDPKFFPAVLDLLTAQLKAWKAAARPDGSAAGISRTQQLYKARLLAGARQFLASRTDGVRPLKESDMASSGTTFEALLGVVFSGGLEATNPYPGFKGESHHFWGAAGLETGASYGAKRGAARGEPGVLLVIHNALDPVRVVAGETLSRRPVAGTDIIAAVVTDGVDTFVLQGPALSALAASSLAWKNHVVAEARAGRLSPFDGWERVQNRFDPDRR